MSTLARVMFSLAKTRMAGMVVQNCFAHWSFLLPVKRLQETPYVLAFSHPRPAYLSHVVIVPKKPIPNLLALSRYPEYATAILTVAQEIGITLQWEAGNYVLCANGGPRQEVQQVHFHLFTGTPPVEVSPRTTDMELVQQTEIIKAVRYPRPDNQLQLTLLPQGNPQTQEAASWEYRAFTACLESLPALNQQFHLMQRGYSFIIDTVNAHHPTSMTGYIVASHTSAKKHLSRKRSSIFA